MNKKAIAILGAIFILIVGTLGFLIYTKYGNSNEDSPVAVNPDANKPSEDGEASPEPTPTPTDTNLGGNDNDSNPTSTPESQAGFIKLTADQVISPVLFYNGSGISYFDKQGKLWQADLETDNSGNLSLERKKQLEIAVKPNFSRVIWPDKGENFFLEFIFLGVKTWSFYDNSLGSYVDLPKEIVSFDWVSGGNQILYVWLENGKATLSLADPDTKNWKEISEMWETDNQVDISPDGLNILYFRTKNSETTNGINLTTPDGKLWRALVKEGYNFGVSWSPDSRKFIFGKKDRTTQKYQLWVYDLYTGDSRNLGLFTTVEKTVWAADGKTLIAAVPEVGLAEDPGLTEDAVYQIDVNTLQKKVYKSGQVKIDGRDLFFSADSSKVFFKNAQDGGLYYLNLK